jgi:hypothetical protein
MAEMVLLSDLPLANRFGATSCVQGSQMRRLVSCRRNYEPIQKSTAHS